MKASKGSIARSVDQPDRSVRFYLFHGPDEAQSRGLGERLLQSMGATRFLIASAALKSDPALLADEAGAMTLFGGPRLLWIEPAGDEIVPAVEALLSAAGAESATVAIAASLRKTSALLKLAEASNDALAFAAYMPEGANAERMVMDLGRRVGLKIHAGLAARIADGCGNDQAVVAQELQKLAIYIDASPHRPKELEASAVEEVGAQLPEGNSLGLADLALGGEIREVADELARVAAQAEAIPIVRALQRRLTMLAPARARIERGESAGAVMTSLDKALFWKDKGRVMRMLETWDAASLATLAERVGQLERTLIFSPAPQHEALGEELLAIARSAHARR